MAQKRKAPRLYLRHWAAKPSRWVIRYLNRMISTGFAEDELAGAEAALLAFCNALDMNPDPMTPYRYQRQDGRIYFVTCDQPDFPIKIGWSQDETIRLQSLQTGLPYKGLCTITASCTKSLQAAQNPP